MLESGVSFSARRIRPVRVGVVVIKVVAHLLDDIPRHLRTAWPVKIRDGVAVMDALESREVLPDFGNWSDFCLCLSGGHLGHDNRINPAADYVDYAFRISAIRARIESAKSARPPCGPTSP
jgi:hypothetical protein